MNRKQCKEAVEAYKNALRNDPADEESRYNLALAKECAEQQGGGGGGEDENEDEEKQDENEENEDQKDEGNEKEDNKEGDDKEDEEGKPKDEKDDKKDGDARNEKKEQQPQQGKLSPQQVKSLLEAMNNQERKVQEKINARNWGFKIIPILIHNKIYSQTFIYAQFLLAHFGLKCNLRRSNT